MLAILAAWLQRPMVLVWTAYFVLLEVLSWLMASGPGACLISPYQYGDTSQNDHQQACPTFFRGFLIVLSWADSFIDDHDKSIVAGFTVVLAVSTIGLWISTYRLWGAHEKQIAVAGRSAKAAEQAADALPVVERAYVYPMIISAGGTGECIREALIFYEGDSTKDDMPIPTTAEITFKIKNYGKTPAILKAAFAGFGVNPIGTELGLSIPESILGEMETTSELTSQMQVGPTRKQAQNIMVYTASMGFSGQITFDDIWGNEHTTRFLFVWDKEIQRMALRHVETTTKSD